MCPLLSAFFASLFFLHPSLFTVGPVAKCGAVQHRMNGPVSAAVSVHGAGFIFLASAPKGHTIKCKQSSPHHYPEDRDGALLGLLGILFWGATERKHDAAMVRQLHGHHWWQCAWQSHQVATFTSIFTRLIVRWSDSREIFEFLSTMWSIFCFLIFSITLLLLLLVVAAPLLVLVQ